MIIRKPAQMTDVSADVGRVLLPRKINLCFDVQIFVLRIYEKLLLVSAS